MKKIFFQASLLVISFFVILFAMRQVNWMNIFQIERITKKTEAKLGDTIWDLYRHTEKESKNKFALACIDSIIDRICTDNRVERDSIKVHLLDKDEVNAFALPNHHLVIYSGLITECINPEELSGVLGHEIAHMELNHVMKKLVKETGMAMLTSIGSGKAGGEVARQAAKVLSSSAFDRSMEKEADIRAVDYMIAAKIDPEPFADFMSRLGGKEGDVMKYLAWVNTHPHSQERAEYILDYVRNKKIEKEVVLQKDTWTRLQETFSGE